MLVFDMTFAFLAIVTAFSVNISVLDVMIVVQQCSICPSFWSTSLLIIEVYSLYFYIASMKSKVYVDADVTWIFQEPYKITSIKLRFFFGYFVQVLGFPEDANQKSLSTVLNRLVIQSSMWTLFTRSLKGYVTSIWHRELSYLYVSIFYEILYHWILNFAYMRL